MPGFMGSLMTFFSVAPLMPEIHPRQALVSCWDGFDISTVQVNYLLFVPRSYAIELRPALVPDLQLTVKCVDGVN
jgi:hypothetical protein